MALISCSECGSQVSDKAAACPRCGNPIAAPELHTPSIPITTSSEDVISVQQTRKDDKLYQAGGAALTGLGLLVSIIGVGGLGVPLMMIGVVLYFYGRFSAWWHTG